MKKKFKKNFVNIGCFFLLITMILFIVAIMSWSSETRIVADDDPEEQNVLVCETDDAEDAFFNPDGVIKSSHKIKVIFNDKKVRKINYTYVGRFSSEEGASKAMDWMHADYNFFMGKTGIYQEALSPTFSVIKEEAIINYSISQENFTSGTAKLVFLDGNNFLPISSYSVNDLQTRFKKRGFTCQYE